ncbi:rhodanese-like domain-containing protein [Dechloromonas sp. TW-R-39-2]|jgi:rhodanese-related sulfurtransferase|uniref:rhodanese-like domain-containing protein n=1 Tax=Dechloromonas sp. TW-R-39-2 TaxID=2654218 RepID=UPI00193E2452|nr:rhodanese-like domain-containing protein [Dechloromonas sp. TW-R-39-2]
MPMEFINQNILLISLVAMSAFGLLMPLLKGRRANELSPAEATQLINREDAHIVDVREADEFAAGHLPEARHIPLAKLAERAGELEKFKDKPLIICCAAGMRSAKGCGELGKLGFAKVYSLAGGVDAWVGAGYPVKKGNRNK